MVFTAKQIAEVIHSEKLDDDDIEQLREVMKENPAHSLDFQKGFLVGRKVALKNSGS